jgi:hypothetical protein
MQPNLTSTIAGAPKRRRKLSPIVIGSAALVLAVAAGLTTWQGLAHRGGARTTATSISRVSDGVVPRDALAEQYPDQQTTTAPPTSVRSQPSDLTVYLVGSEAEAVLLYERLSLATQFGEPYLNAQVVVAASADEAIALGRQYAEQNAYRAMLGLVPITLIDRRGE